MRVDLKRFRVEKAASKDETRPILNNVYLDVDNGVLVATDSYSMAVVPVELALDDTSGLIPVEALAIARKDQGKRDQAEVVANGSVSVALRGKRAEFERADAEDKFPDWVNVFRRQKGKPILTFAISPALLKSIADALGGGAVKIEVFDVNEPLRVTPLGIAGDLGAKGIAMPIRLGEAA